jgi:hypothetical protein
MVKRNAPIRVICFFLWAACGAFCQERPSADLLQGLQLDGSNSPEMQRQEMRTWRSLSLHLHEDCAFGGRTPH